MENHFTLATYLAKDEAMPDPKTYFKMETTWWKKNFGDSKTRVASKDKHVVGRHTVKVSVMETAN